MISAVIRSEKTVKILHERQAKSIPKTPPFQTGSMKPIEKLEGN